VISARFQERRPGWSVDFKQVSWSDASAGLLDGSSHVAILWLPVPDSAALSWRVLASEPRWVALSQGTGSPVAGPAGVVCKPVGGLSPSQLAVAWRTRDERALVRDFVAACRQAATEQR
jgi:hypothetical protein